LFQEQAIEDDAEAVDIGADIELVDVTGGLLGGHVSGCAGEVGVHGKVDAAGFVENGFGQTEVQDVGVCVGVDEDVTGFEITVNDTALVGVMDGLADGGGELEDIAAGHVVGFDIEIEGDAVDALHGIEVDTAIQTAVVDAGDVGMIEAGGEFDFAIEAMTGTVGSEHTGAHELERDLAMGAELDGMPDGTHPALTEGFEDLVAFDFGGPGQERIGQLRERWSDADVREVGGRIDQHGIFEGCSGLRIQGPICDFQWKWFWRA
jgi:hypothetical protein